MPRLTAEQLRSRLTLDFRVVKAMEATSELFRAEAYSSAEHLRSGRGAIRDELQAGKAKHYKVLFRVNTFGGPGWYLKQTKMHLDLLANGNYPFTEPICQVLSQIPWSPHFYPSIPVCIGDIWTMAKGNLLVAHLIVHLLKLLNFDEAPHGEGYVGYNPEAAEYWTEKMHCRPVTPGLVYPAIPAELTHGVGVARDPGQGSVKLFTPVSKKAVAMIPDPAMFRRAGS